jgi:hypothetical protein
MKTSESQKELLQALLLAKMDFPRIAKNKKGQAGNRQFNYAPLDEINDAVDPVLFKYGLIVSDSTEGHNLITRLDHVVSGEWRQLIMPVNEQHANMQSYGIELTYRRRYAKQLILGIVTEEDTDIRTKDKRAGVDHTESRNENGTLRAYTDNPKRDAFEALPPEIQDALRKAAPQIDKAIPDTVKAIDIATMAVESWPDADAAEVKKGLWYLLDSKTRSAIDAVQKAGRARNAKQEQASPNGS